MMQDQKLLVITIHPEGIMNVCTKFHDYPPNSH